MLCPALNFGTCFVEGLLSLDQDSFTYGVTLVKRVLMCKSIVNVFVTLHVTIQIIGQLCNEVANYP